MNKNEIIKDLFEIINSITQEKLKINEDTALIGQKILDSLDFMNYISQIEEKYNVSLDDDIIENKQLGIMKNMVDYLYNISN